MFPLLERTRSGSFLSLLPVSLSKFLKISIPTAQSLTFPPPISRTPIAFVHSRSDRNRPSTGFFLVILLGPVHNS